MVEAAQNVDETTSKLSEMEGKFLTFSLAGEEYIAAEVTWAGADEYLIKDPPGSDVLRRAISGKMTNS
jgi:hypothetical protein